MATVEAEQQTRVIDLIDAAWRARGYETCAQFAAVLSAMPNSRRKSWEPRFSNWRRGQGEPSVSDCRQIAAALGVSLGSLLAGETPVRDPLRTKQGQFLLAVRRIGALCTQIQEQAIPREIAPDTAPPVVDPSMDSRDTRPASDAQSA